MASDGQTSWAVSPSPRDAGEDGRELVLANARIILSGEILRGALFCRNGIITDISTGPTTARGALDMAGDFLLPGLVDVHTDHLEKQTLPRAGVFWNAISAAMTHDATLAAAGITTVFDSLVVGAVGNPDRRALLPLMIAGLRDAENHGLLRTGHFLHLRCDAREEGLLDLIEPWFEDPRLCFVTIMDDSPSRDAERYRRLQRRKHILDDIIEAEIATGDAEAALTRANRSKLVEACRRRRLPLASHDDTRIEHIAEAEADGMTISEFPTSTPAARAARAAGMTIIAGAPNIVFGRSHIGNVSGRDLAGEGLIDVVCSDYVPASLLHGLWTLTREPIGLSLPDAIAMGSRRPATLFGLGDRGALAPGLRADIIRVSEINGAPFVRSVWVGGRCVL